MTRWKRRALAAETELAFIKRTTALAYLGEPITNASTTFKLTNYETLFDVREPFVVLIGNTTNQAEAVYVASGDGSTLYGCVRGWGGLGHGRGDEARAHPLGESVQRAS